jgi:hypothetical protein
MCDLSHDEQGALGDLLANLQTAQAKLATTFPDVFRRAWADHDAMLVGIEELTTAAGQLQQWVMAKHHSTAA